MLFIVLCLCDRIARDMRYDIHSWEEFAELADDINELDKLVFHIGGREMRADVISNEQARKSVETS